MNAPSSFVRRTGVVTAVNGVVAAIGATALIVVPPAVGTDRVSYPLTPTGFALIQSYFAVNHVIFAITFVALQRSGALGGRRYAAVGAWIAVAGWLWLAAQEVWGVLLADSAYPTSTTDVWESLYGGPVLLVLIGSTLCGVAVARAGVWPGWRRWVVLLSAVWIVVPVLPALVSADFVAGRLALGAWNLLYAAIGLSLAGHTARSAGVGERAMAGSA
jgi:hypothetical protein